MSIIKSATDKAKRHRERHNELGYKYVISQSIDFVNINDWDKIAKTGTIFLSRNYLKSIEALSPENTTQHYAIAYSSGLPIVIVACQLAEITGEKIRQYDSRVKEKIARNYKERVLVCGNLVSSGLHGVLFSDLISEKEGWRIVAEVLYRIRRSESITDKVDFVLIKDLKGNALENSKVIERYSYRKIQTDPDMVIEFNNQTKNFNDYLLLLNTKYRSRIKKVIKTLEEAGFYSKELVLNNESDKQIHNLYLNVERKSNTRLATLPVGYFAALSKNLAESFSCIGIHRNEQLVGFISVIKDGDDAIAYYVGFDYEINDQYPLYFRLLQLSIETAIKMQCKRVLLGRSALEPKANLGAQAIDTHVWARHRVPLVNFIVRKLFRNIPFDHAPERNVMKKCAKVNNPEGFKNNG